MTTHFNRRTALQSLAALGSTGLLGTSLAQSAKDAWPASLIKLIVPFPAGGPTDTASRIVGQKLAERAMAAYSGREGKREDLKCWISWTICRSTCCAIAALSASSLS